MPKITVVLVLLLCITVGCHTSPPTHTTPALSKPTAVASTPSAPTADEQEIEVPSDPAWTQTFKRAAGLIGKPKADVVAQLGPPKAAVELFGDLRYDYDGPDYRMQLHFRPYTPDRHHPDPNAEVTRPVSAVAFQVTQRSTETADTCWEAIGGKSGGPTRLIYPSERRFLPASTFTDPIAPGFPVRLKGQLTNGTLCVVEGGNPETLLLQGEKTFDLRSDTYRFSPPHRNPKFTWQRTQVGFLFAGDTRHLLWAMHHFDTEIPLP